MPEAPAPELIIAGHGRRFEEVLWDAVRPVYDVGADDLRFRAFSGEASDRARHFDRLRKEYPMRREFRYTRLRLRDVDAAARRALGELEFAVWPG
jgi:erythronate-4-phosphate dehydrogenase